MTQPIATETLETEALALAEATLAYLSENTAKLALAESCTGGLIAAFITECAGASDVLVESAVTYANAAKIRRLGVRPETLAGNGAVSAACVNEMAAGARREAGVAVALAVSGIAGPGGGSPDKPVGTVFIALATAGGIRVEKKQYEGNRRAIRLQTVCDSLKLIMTAFE